MKSDLMVERCLGSRDLCRETENLEALAFNPIKRKGQPSGALAIKR